jgi:hypothetical protein
MFNFLSQMPSKIVRAILHYPKKFLSLFFRRRLYEITPRYYHRRHPKHWDDTINKDEYQKEVYEYALNFAERENLKTVLDYGCGSAFKLLKYFYNFEITGVDIDPTLSWLKTNYPKNTWLSPEKLVRQRKRFDLILCADVIEHLPNPDLLLKNFENLDPRFIIFSTPDRGLINDNRNMLGPPWNPSHCREWNFEEFENYIGKNFEVLDHRVTNEAQWTQLIVAKCV